VSWLERQEDSFTSFASTKESQSAKVPYGLKQRKVPNQQQEKRLE